VASKLFAVSEVVPCDTEDDEEEEESSGEVCVLPSVIVVVSKEALPSPSHPMQLLREVRAVTTVL